MTCLQCISKYAATGCFKKWTTGNTVSKLPSPKIGSVFGFAPSFRLFFSTFECLGGSGTSCIPSFVFDVTSRIKIIRYTVQIIIIRNEVLERRKKESMYSC